MTTPPTRDALTCGRCGIAGESVRGFGAAYTADGRYFQNKPPYAHEDRSACIVALREQLTESEQARARAEAQFADCVADKVSVSSFNVDDGVATLKLHTDMALVIGESLRGLLDGANAANYVEMQMHASDGKQYIMTLRRGERPTPHELRLKAERERDDARLDAERLQAIADAAALYANRARGRDELDPFGYGVDDAYDELCKAIDTARAATRGVGAE